MTFKKKDIGDDYEIEMDQSNKSQDGDFEQLLKSSFQKKETRLSVGSKIKAEVLSVGKENIIVSTGTRTDGIVALQDLLDSNGKKDIKVGDILELYVTQMRSESILLSPYLSQYSSKSRQGYKNKAAPDSAAAAKTSFRDQLKIGTQIQGKVTRIEPFGAFIELAPGTEGLAHVSELSWTRIKDPSEVVKVGDLVMVQVLNIEQGDRKMKISLTLKDASKNPWQNIPSHIQAGRVVLGKVTRCAPFGAFVELAPGMDGLVPLSELSSSKRVNNAEEVVTIGQEVSVLVKEVNPETKRISLSIKAATDAAASASEAQDIQDYAKQQSVRSKQGSSDFAAKMLAALNKKK